MRKTMFFAVSIVLASTLGFSVNATMINFDDVSSGTVVNNQYAGSGVTFSTALPTGGSVIATTPSGAVFTALSSPNIVSIGTDGFNQVDDGVIRADFTTAQTSVSISANVISVGEQIGNEPRGTAYLSAYDSLNNLLDTDTLAGVFGQTGYSTLTVSSANIAKVYFSVDYGGATSFVTSYGFFDNFQFGENGSAPIPEPGTMLLLGSGLVGLAGYGRRRFKK